MLPPPPCPATGAAAARTLQCRSADDIDNSHDAGISADANNNILFQLRCGPLQPSAPNDALHPWVGHVETCTQARDSSGGRVMARHGATLGRLPQGSPFSPATGRALSSTTYQDLPTSVLAAPFAPELQQVTDLPLTDALTDLDA